MNNVVKILLLVLLPMLAACGGPHERAVEVGDNYDLGRQNVLHVSQRQRTALVSLFDSGVPIKSVRWPSNAVIHLFANQDFFKAIDAPLPQKHARRFGADKPMKRAAWYVYQNSVARGLDKPLIDRYFKSRMGRREIRGTYLMVLAYRCYKAQDKIPQAIKDRAKHIFDQGGPVNFHCPKDPSIRARTIR